jgi:hypothetical protein
LLLLVIEEIWEWRGELMEGRGNMVRERAKRFAR